MVKRKKLHLMVFFSLIASILSLLFFIFYFVIDIDKSFIFLISIFVFLSFCFLIIFSYLCKIFSDVKNQLIVLERKEKAVKDIYRYEQFLNPPDIDN